MNAHATALIADDEALLETMRKKYADNCADFVPSDGPIDTTPGKKHEPNQ